MVVQTNDRGELELHGLAAGSYTFMLTPNNGPGGKSISEKGVALVAGQPIGGIVVKGGKNPGGNMMVIQTNDKGEFSFQASEAGDYKFIVTAPAGKSISEKGLK